MFTFSLCTVFIPRINKALNDFAEAFNNHAVSTEGNWTPNQMWINGMLHANNPLAHGSLDDEPDDPEGPSLQEHNNVVVEPVTLDNSILLKSWRLLTLCDHPHNLVLIFTPKP